MKLSLLDTLIVLVYLAGVFALAQWVSREKAGHEKTAKDYFLASKALPWWAIGASLIAANISAEQIIGMSGSGYRSEEHTSELQSRLHLVCRLLLEKKKTNQKHKHDPLMLLQTSL